MTPIVTTMSAPAGRGRRVKAPGLGVVTPFFSDDLAGGQFNSANGFTWGALTGQIANQKQIVADPADGSKYALRIRALSDANAAAAGSTNQAEIEHRFNMGRDVTSLWLEYRIYAPSNFAHRDGPGADNNKLLRLWGPEDYSVKTTTMGASFYRTTAPILGVTYNFGTRVRSERQTTISVASPNSPPTESPNAQLFNTLGAWHTHRWYYRYPTATVDAQVTFWLDGVQQFNWTDPGMYYDATRPYLRQGYILGAANSGYDNDTDFYFADFKFYDQNPGWV